ncbi:hypothetical protein PILCRDRAFT_8665 [Piloderma croceum F 1598]|uniref:Tyrosinase copper-binding domain-containing protein n=1 Tax=Piloderma croceum (strain F 1598) TaxID=765440 RepID=A0A0C3FR79_PILCF|nr:hypothetical protein PILCRDRAFT_8665 [Piloderma croceum F 1598]
MVRLFALALLSTCIFGLSSGTVTPKCKQPAVRKEWRALGPDGQKAFTDAIKASICYFGATPDLPPIQVNSSRYDDVVYVHMDAVNSAHFTGRFLPWHRLFLHTMEGLLRDQCGYKGYLTYWDWTIDSHDIKHSPIFNADPAVGLGTFPNETTNFELSNGAFRDIIRAYPTAHHIQRNYTLRPFEIQIFPWTFNLPNKEANTTQTTAEYIKLTTSFIGNFTAFQAYMDGFRAEGLHNAAHLSLGGDMANISHSPNDPLFFLLHSQLDRVWAAWQAHNRRNRNAIAGGVDQDLNDFDAHPLGTGTPVTGDTVLYMAGIGQDATVNNVFSTTGGYLCYEYAT